MKIEIKSRWTGKVLFAVEAGSLKIAMKIAVKQGANLAEADLAGAYLARADLGRANLAGANLAGANLARANLGGANLARANLAGADLAEANLAGAYLAEANLGGAYLARANLARANLARANLGGAYLGRANLAGADLARANLAGANLAGADLAGANLARAYLAEANLGGAKNINKYRFTSLLMLYDQVGKIRAYKLVNQQNEGIYNGGLKYEIGQTISVEKYETDDTIQCAAGINLATLDWCMKEWREGYKILICEFTSKDIAAIPIATDGKFRVKKCKVIKEVDLVKIGLKDEDNN